MSIGPFEVNSVVCGDCLDIMRQIPDGSIDLIFADPPFNAGKDYGDFDDSKEVEDYYSWLLVRLEEMVRILRVGGALWLMNSPTHIGFCQVSLDELGLTFRNMVVWAYAGPTPAKGHLPKTWRPILFYSKGKLNCFHQERVELERATLYYNPTKAETRPVHDLWPDIPKLVGGYLAPPELLETLDGKFAHPTQMPERIAERIILLTSDEGDLVFDPFAGTGTIAVVAKRLGRSYIVCDISKKFVEMTNIRLKGGSKRVREMEAISRQLSLLDEKNG